MFVNTHLLCFLNEVSEYHQDKKELGMESIMCVTGELDTRETSIDRIWQSMPKRAVQKIIKKSQQIYENN